MKMLKIPCLKITAVMLISLNIVNNDYQHDSRILDKFVPNKPFLQLLNTSPKNFTFLKTFNSEFSFIHFSTKSLEMEDKKILL